MASSLDRLKALTNRLEDKVEQKHRDSDTLPKIKNSGIDNYIIYPQKIEMTSDSIQEENIKRILELYNKLNIFEKSPDFDKIFDYKAMNLSGIGLKNDDFGQVRKGKYIQVIAITYEADKYGKKKAKNISLGYFGKAETIDYELKKEIIEFVLRWRYEKAFQNLKHYKDLIIQIETIEDINCL